ncbi:unnamed protein product [Closterium sp. Yama58-4]|nr:unnamed protein product [Closterium sp. Yama58-4]
MVQGQLLQLHLSLRLRKRLLHLLHLSLRLRKRLLHLLHLSLRLRKRLLHPSLRKRLQHLGAEETTAALLLSDCCRTTAAERLRRGGLAPLLPHRRNFAHRKQQGRVCLPALRTPAAARPAGNAVGEDATR